MLFSGRSAGCAFVALFACLAAAECTDGVCPLPTQRSYSVLSPVPETAVTPMKQGNRLESLDGKTIALVGGSFMANVTHPELKRLILAEFPSAKVYLLSEIGSAGPWRVQASSGARRTSSRED